MRFWRRSRTDLGYQFFIHENPKAPILAGKIYFEPLIPFPLAGLPALDDHFGENGLGWHVEKSCLEKQGSRQVRSGEYPE